MRQRQTTHRRDSGASGKQPSALKREGGGAHQQQHSWKNTHTAFAVLSGTALLEERTPNTYIEALASVDCAKWREAMKVEYEGCEGQSTWVVVPRARLPQHTNICALTQAHLLSLALAIASL